jgi:AAA domain
MTVENLLAANKISGIRSTAHGRYYVTCPRCSSKRSKAHQREKVLGVTIDGTGAHWGCNHCGWTGPERGTGNGANGHARGNENLTTYDYFDEHGELLFQKVRGANKKFWQRKRDGAGGWTNKLGDTRKVIYRLPEVNEAIAAGHAVVVVEGEKDADNLWHIGVPATCNPDGASEPDKKPKWRAAYSELLRGADIIVMGDNDPAGRAHVEATASMSVGIAARVRVLDLAKHWPAIPQGGDVSDWLKAGHTREELDALIERAPDYDKVQIDGAAHALSLTDWLARDLPEPDFILGNWLTTTSRTLLVAPTGLGKTMVALGLGMAIASGLGFLHWRGIRSARVLVVDGEMPRRLMKRRLADEARRLGAQPATMTILSHEDIEKFAPLNTPEGQAQIEREIVLMGGADLVIFDNIMSLIAGDMKDEEGWRKLEPWIRSLTSRCIAQIWVHHTGHDETRSYGTKTREWQMDNVIHLERVERPDTDVSFQLHFNKARERMPETRADFADVRIALINDQWISEGASAAGKKSPLPTSRKFLDALRDATIGNKMLLGCPAASLIEWHAECVKHGLIEPTARPKSARTLFARHKLDLITKNWIACNETMAWVLP